MIFTAFSDGRFAMGAQETRCALGRSGVVAADLKREGDGASPLGVWPLRRLIFRADRGPSPRTALPRLAMEPQDGWCDDPWDAAYNSPVTHPYPVSAEHLWREDALYDRVVVLGYNDNPVTPGAGSAIFLHIARPGYAPTEGCVALTRDDLDTLLARAQDGDALEIRQA